MKDVMKRVSRRQITRFYNKEYIDAGLLCRTFSPQLGTSFEDELCRVIEDEIGSNENLVIENLSFERIPDKDLGQDSILIMGDIIEIKEVDPIDKINGLLRNTGNSINTSGTVNVPYQSITSNSILGFQGPTGERGPVGPPSAIGRPYIYTELGNSTSVSSDTSASSNITCTYNKLNLDSNP